MSMGTLLMVSTIFGAVGVGYFVYGRKQQKLIPLLAGIGLCVFPYFVSNLFASLAIGILLILLPWLIPS